LWIDDDISNEPSQLNRCDDVLNVINRTAVQDDSCAKAKCLLVPFDNFLIKIVAVDEVLNVVVISKLVSRIALHASRTRLE
jgi:hypothetical protein